MTAPQHLKAIPCLTCGRAQSWINDQLSAWSVGPETDRALRNQGALLARVPPWLPTRKMGEGGIRGAGKPSWLRGALAAKLRIEQPTGKHLDVGQVQLRHAHMIRQGCAVADLARCHRPDDVFPCQSRASHSRLQVDPPSPSCLVVIAWHGASNVSGVDPAGISCECARSESSGSVCVGQRINK